MNEAQRRLIQCYYLGQLDSHGHYLWSSPFDRLSRKDAESIGMPFSWQWLDSRFAPQDTRKAFLADVHDVEKWTVFSYWDYTIDTRPGSNSTFAFNTQLCFRDALIIATERFPAVFKRIPENQAVQLHFHMGTGRYKELVEKTKQGRNV